MTTRQRLFLVAALVLGVAFQIKLSAAVQSAGNPSAGVKAAGENKKRSPEQIRTARGKRWNSPKLLLPPQTIDEIPSVTTTVDYDVSATALPIRATPYVLLAVLDDEQSHATPDRTRVYTEYSGHVKDVLKAPAQSVVIGSQIAVLRLGGELTLPNGRVVRHEVYGQGQRLKRGGTYLLFLHFDEAADAYGVSEAWQLLDGRPRPTIVHADSSDIERLTALDEEAFLAQVRARAAEMH